MLKKSCVNLRRTDTTARQASDNEPSKNFEQRSRCGDNISGNKRYESVLLCLENRQNQRDDHHPIKRRRRSISEVEKSVALVLPVE